MRNKSRRKTAPVNTPESHEKKNMNNSINGFNDHKTLVLISYCSTSSSEGKEKAIEKRKMRERPTSITIIIVYRFIGISCKQVTFFNSLLNEIRLGRFLLRLAIDKVEAFDCIRCKCSLRLFM